MENSYVIDFKQNSASLKISEDIYIRILTKATEQTRNDIVDLETAIPIGNFDKIKAIAHRLKGDYDNMRITGLSLIAKQMDETAKTSQDKEMLTAQLGEFKKIFSQLQEKLLGGKP